MKPKPAPRTIVQPAAIKAAPITEIPTPDTPSVTQASNDAQIAALRRGGRRSTILSRRRSESGGRYDTYSGKQTGASV